MTTQKKSRIELYLEEQARQAQEVREEVFGKKKGQYECNEEPEMLVTNSMMPYPYESRDNPVMGFFSPDAKVEEKKEHVLVTSSGQTSVLGLQDAERVLKKEGGSRFMYPPGRHNVDVTGQEKLMVDVALMLQHVRKTDTVLVVGSYSKNRGGRAYYLLVGQVKRIDLYDPYETEQSYVEMGTEVNHYAKAWDVKVPVTADIFINDASLQIGERHETIDVEMACTNGVPNTRVYSLKRFGKYDTRYTQSAIYHQIRYTRHNEWREVYPPRIPHKYQGQLGTCRMCREVDYFNTMEYGASFMLRWSAMHDSSCTLRVAARPQDVRYFSRTLGVCTVNPIYVRKEGRIQMPFRKEANAYGILEERVLAQGLLSMHLIPAVMSHYINFDLTDPMTGISYATTSTKSKDEVCVSEELPRECVPHAFVYYDGVLMIGPRVFQIDFTQPEPARKLLERRLETLGSLQNEVDKESNTSKLKKKVAKPIIPMIYGSENMPNCSTLSIRHPSESKIITRQPATLMSAVYRLASFKYCF